MFEFLPFLTQESVASFFLLFIRFSAILAFFPFFSYPTISNSIKAALAFYLTVLYFPALPTLELNFDINSIMVAVVSELTLGLIAGLILKIVFFVLSFAGELISFVMGFSMASVMDPSTQNQTPLIGQILGLIGLLIFLAFDGHHMILLFIHKSLVNIPLGEFVLSDNLPRYLMRAMANFYMIGFSLAFPILALSLLADIIFGMIMKTNPQFNLLVIGFPIKIIIGFMVFTASLGSLMFIFKREFKTAFEALQMFYN